MAVNGLELWILLDSSGMLHTRWSYAFSNPAGHPLSEHFTLDLLSVSSIASSLFPFSTIHFEDRRCSESSFPIEAFRWIFQLFLKLTLPIGFLIWTHSSVCSIMYSIQIFDFSSLSLLCFETLIRISNRLIRWSVRSDSWNVHFLIE